MGHLIISYELQNAVGTQASELIAKLKEPRFAFTQTKAGDDRTTFYKDCGGAHPESCVDEVFALFAKAVTDVDFGLSCDVVFIPSGTAEQYPVVTWKKIRPRR